MAVVRRLVSTLNRVAPLVIVFWFAAGAFGGWKVSRMCFMSVWVAW
jgi:hypothetical protein